MIKLLLFFFSTTYSQFTYSNLSCTLPPDYLSSKTIITEFNTYVECNCTTTFSSTGLYKIFSFDGHTTVASIIPQNRLYKLDSVIYIETNRNGTPIAKIAESTFFKKEFLTHYFDPDPITTSMEITTTRNTNGYPILIWVISSGNGLA